ncbi:MAG: NTP transferase domain-containing protein [Bacteroidetes bacterium]|nr:NTP transferase domain-containing protein [Bacteroidota bacterium]
MDEIAILAGGLATRLKPVSETVPKSLIEVAGKPFIYHQLKLLQSKGIRKAVICAGYLGEQIQNYVGDGKEFGIQAEYSFDGDKLLGTGGALRKSLKFFRNDFFILYGDSYLDAEFEDINEYFLKSNKCGLMTVLKNDGKWDKSNIEFENGEILVYDKKVTSGEMRYIDYGLGILNKKAFEDFENREVFDLEEVYRDLLKKKQLAGFEVHKRFYEIGSFTGLEETEKYLLNKKHANGFNELY